MRKLRLWVILFFMVLSVGKCTNPESPSPTLLPISTYYEYSSDELEVINLINAHRSSLSLPELTLRNILSSVAEYHNIEMISNGVVNHDGFPNRVTTIRYYFGDVKVGENIAYGYGTSLGILNAWISSEGHSNVLNNPKYYYHGFSLRRDSLGRSYSSHILITE